MVGESFNPFPCRSNPCRELAWFLTTGIVVSAFALPIVLARAPVAVSVSFSWKDIEMLVATTSKNVWFVTFQVTPAPTPPNSTTTTPPISTTADPSGQFTTVVCFDFMKLWIWGALQTHDFKVNVHNIQIKGGPCFMTLIANGCIFTTLGALFQTFPDNDGWGY